MKKHLILVCATLHLSSPAMLPKQSIIRSVIRYGASRSFSHNPQSIQTQLQDLQNSIPDEVLHRYQRDYDVDEHDARLIRDEWVRYALLSKIKPQASYGMFSRPVNDFWHTFLLFTKAYENYFKSFPVGDKTILHHIPHEATSMCLIACQWQEKKKFLDAYKTMFGEQPMSAAFRIWHTLTPCSLTSCATKGCEYVEANPQPDMYVNHAMKRAAKTTGTTNIIVSGSAPLVR